jgi:hypothetical protein
VSFTTLSYGNDLAVVGVHLPRGAAQQDDIDVAAAEKEAAAKVAAPIATSDKKNKPKTGK